MFRDTTILVAQRSHNKIGDESRNPLMQSDEEEVAVTQALDQAIEAGGNKKMAALIGHINAFDESTEQWSTYTERFEHFVDANDVPAEKKVAAFLSVIGATTYGLLCGLLAPAKPGDKSYEDFVKVLKDHFSPKPIVIAERFRFHKRNQEEGESVAQYVAVLKKLWEHCAFGDHLQDALRDRLVCGLSNENIQRKLLTEEALTFQRAVDTAMSMETVTRESQHLKSSLKVHAVSVSPPQGGDKCFRCGKSNHHERDCYYREQLCHNCKRKGHIARLCKNKKSDHKHTKEKHETKMKPKKHFDKAKGKIHKVEANASDSERESVSDSDSELRLHMVSAVINDTEPVMAVKKDDAASSSMMIRAKIEGLVIDTELDTGAAVSLISMDMYKAKLAHLRLRKTDVVLKKHTLENYCYQREC